MYIHVLRTGKNTYYSPFLKEEIINKVFVHHHSITSTAINHKKVKRLISVMKLYGIKAKVKYKPYKDNRNGKKLSSSCHEKKIVYIIHQ